MNDLELARSDVPGYLKRRMFLRRWLSYNRSIMRDEYRWKWMGRRRGNRGLGRGGTFNVLGESPGGFEGE